MTSSRKNRARKKQVPETPQQELPEPAVREDKGAGTDARPSEVAAVRPPHSEQLAFTLTGQVAASMDGGNPETPKGGPPLSAIKASPTQVCSASDLRRAYLRSNRDLPSKVLAGHLYSSMGYTTLLETDFSTYSYGSSYKKEQISDLDVYAIRFEHDLSSSAVVVECKSGEGNSLEYLLKLDGICHLKRAHHGVLIQARIPANAREVAANLGHTTWDLSELRTMLVNSDLWREGLEDDLLDLYISKAELRKDAQREFPKLSRFLKSDYWISPPSRNIHSILAGLSQARGTFSDKREPHLLLLDEAVLLLSIAILCAANTIIRNYLSQPTDCLKDFLFGGARERRDREVLFDRINQQVGGGHSFLPDYYEPLAELVVRYASSPGISRKVPRLWATMIDRRVHSLEDLKAVASSSNPTLLKFVKDLLRFVSKETKVTPEHWSTILQL